MRTLYLLTIINVALIITGCAETTPTPKAAAPQETQAPITPPKCHHKDPMKVGFYLNKQKPNMPYQVVGLAEVPKFNSAGVRLQEATIRDLMSQMAASLGGDAVMNFKHDDKAITGTVISYQKVLA